MNEEKNLHLETATFGAGCFWGVESTYSQLSGVISTQVGYAGGSSEHPTYEEVCNGATGHAEVVQVTFDPSQISYEKLLHIFWMNHNPTTLNRQSPDIGDQYRSVIFYYSTEQKEIALASKKTEDSSGKWTSAVVTQIVPKSPFYEAEEYHQKYFEKQGKKGTCYM